MGWRLWDNKLSYVYLHIEKIVQMKKITLKLFIVLSVLLTLTQCRPASNELKVVSFNIRMGVADDGGEFLGVPQGSFRRDGQ